MEKNRSFVKVQLKDAQMVELYTIYDRLNNNYPVNSRHDLLMLEHISALRDRLRKMIGKCAQRYTLKMEGAELVAFTQLWERSNLDMSAYLGRIIQLIFSKINHGNLQRLKVCTGNK